MALLLVSSWKAEVTMNFQGLAVGKTVPPGRGKACEGKKRMACKDSLRLSTYATVNIRKSAHLLKMLTARGGARKTHRYYQVEIELETFQELILRYTIKPSNSHP